MLEEHHAQELRGETEGETSDRREHPEGAMSVDPMTAPVGPAQETSKTPEAAGMCYLTHHHSLVRRASGTGTITHREAPSRCAGLNHTPPFARVQSHLPDLVGSVS